MTGIGEDLQQICIATAAAAVLRGAGARAVKFPRAYLAEVLDRVTKLCDEEAASMAAVRAKRAGAAESSPYGKKG